MLAKRNPEAVRELESLQQQERQGAGEPSLTTEDFIRLLRDDFQSEQMRRDMETGGLESVIANDDQYESQADEALKTRLNEWRLDDPTQWSRYENPGHRWGIAKICSRIETVYERHNWQLPELPVVGTLTTGQVSAATQKTSSGSPIILIDNGFFRFAGIMGQLTLFAPYDFQVKQYFSEATLQLVADVVATHVCLNTCLYTYPRQTPPQYEGLVTGYVEGICTFVLAHEYAHILAGDLDAHPLNTGPARGLRSKEFEADKLGFITAIEAANGTEQPAAHVFGAFIYLCGLDLLARAEAAYHGREVVTETDPSPDDYPTPQERVLNLLQWLETTSYKDHGIDPNDPIRAAAAAYNIILFAWGSILPAFTAAREDLSAFDPALHGPPANPQAASFAVVHALWLRIVASLGGQS